MEKRTQNLNKRGNIALEWLEEKVALLKREHLPRLGRWEIAKKAEPISAMLGGKESALDLTAVVHQESHFILGTLVSPFDEGGSGVTVFIEAVKRHRVLPEILLVRDKKLYDEFVPIADELNFKLSHEHKLKAIPQVFRAITSMLA